MTPHHLLCTVGAPLGMCGTAALADPPARPNILLIVSDDQGFADVGVQGCRDFATPHLDSIARGGLRFTSGYVSAPQCAPSRCGLLTGRYQQRFGYEYNNDGPGAEPQRATALQQRWDAWNRTLMAPFGGAPKTRDAKRAQRPDAKGAETDPDQ